MIDGDREWMDGSTGSKVPAVRAEILASWRRSRLSGVDASEAGPVAGHSDGDWRISRVGVPVLESMAEMLVGANTSLLLSAPDGTLIWRWDENTTLRGRLNRSSAVVGTCWSEEAIGTNGLGTALETGKPITISGAEHYSESLHPFVCAGAPIRHPVTRRVTGVLSVTSFVKDASPLMGPTLLRLARDVEQELYSESSLHEREMIQHFLAERRRHRCAVVAVSAEVFIANSAASSLHLDRADLWRQIEESPDDQVGRLLDDGGALITGFQPVKRGGRVIGAIVVGGDPEAVNAPRARRGHSSGESSRDATWEACALAARRALSQSEGLLVTGEPGVGKRTLIRSVLGLTGGVAEVDCALIDAQGTRQWLSAAEDLVRDPTVHTIVVAHVEFLKEEPAQSLAAVFELAKSRGVRVVSTHTPSRAGWPIPAAIRDRLPLEAVEITPLRKRPKDVLHRLANREPGETRLTRRATEVALRHPWPGNDRQLDGFLRWLREQTQAWVDCDDLPSEWRAASARQHLTAIQVAEADAIVNALRDSAGNKAVAARKLGISRSSMYRKMREYHLD